MYVREYMTTPPITVNPDTLLDEALMIAQEHRIRRIPVVDDGKLVGLVTRQTLRQASLSTSVRPMSTFGMRYQLLRMKVRDIMITNVITVSPDTTLEEAVTLAGKHQIGTLPVVDDEGNLIGMVTNTDINNLTSQLLGFGQQGIRLCISGLSGPKDIRRYQILEILSKYKAGVLSAFNVTVPVSQQKCFIVLLDSKDPKPIVDDIEKLGLKLEVRQIAYQSGDNI